MNDNAIHSHHPYHHYHSGYRHNTSRTKSLTIISSINIPLLVLIHAVVVLVVIIINDTVQKVITNGSRYSLFRHNRCHHGHKHNHYRDQQSGTSTSGTIIIMLIIITIIRVASCSFMQFPPGS